MRKKNIAMDDGDIVGTAGEPGFHVSADPDEEAQTWCGIPAEIIVYNTIVEENGIVRFFGKVEQLVMIRVLCFQVVRSGVSLVHCRLQIACLGVSRIAHR